MMVLVILQCAYFLDGKPRRRVAWLRGLERSHTGKRLKEMLPDGVDYYVINASQETGSKPDAVFPPDIKYIKQTIEHISPTIILACGKVAQEAVDEIESTIPIIKTYHPAFRGLSKDITKSVSECIQTVM